MKKAVGPFLCASGVMFLLWAIFGRYLVLPGYLKSLEEGISGTAVPSEVPIFFVIRYLLWAFAFKLCIYFFVLGAMQRSSLGRGAKTMFATVGLVYICLAYMELPFDSSLFMGVGGGILTLLFLFMFYDLAQAGDVQPTSAGQTAATGQAGLFPWLGFFFLAMAAYNLCPLLGVKCFALEPELMIRYGLQSQARSFANHIMIELLLGFLFLGLARLRPGSRRLRRRA